MGSASPTADSDRKEARRFFSCSIFGRNGSLGSAVTDGFAETGPVILFDNAGIASSSGETPIRLMRWRSTPRFRRALGLSQVDLLGFSIGGYVAQSLRYAIPKLIRRLILVGTGPRAGDHRRIRNTANMAP